MMKRLMILGGARYALPVIKAAHELGCYVITCDYLPNNIAHKYSDEYVNVSVVDKEAVLEVAKAKHIDGIMSFACDPGVVTAAYVAEKLGLPSVGSYESVSILQDKGRFRKFLKDNGFNVPESKTYRSIDEIEKNKNEFCEILFVLNMVKIIFQILKNGKIKVINGYYIMKMDGFHQKLFRLRKAMNGLLILLMLFLAVTVIWMIGIDIWTRALNMKKMLKLLLKKILIVGRILKARL